MDGSATKTINAGYKTKWVTNDAISVFHAVSGTTDYVSDNGFVIADVLSNRFDGEITNGPLQEETKYDWYAIYPWNSHYDTPAYENTTYTTLIGPNSSTKTFKQEAYNSMSHLAGNGFPLIGRAMAVASSEYPTIVMRNVASVLSVRVYNKLNKEISIDKVFIISPENIIGSYAINLTGDEAILTSKASGESKIVKLEVVQPDFIKSGDYADFYFGIKPFTAPLGSTMSILVYASDGSVAGVQTVSKVLDSDLVFSSNKIKAIEVDLTSDPVNGILSTKADFETLNDGAKASGYKTYSTYEGWLATNCCVQDESIIPGITSLAACLNGKRTTPGIIASPRIANGCGTISFKYAHGYAESNGISFRVDIKNAAGEVVKSFTETKNPCTQKEIYSFSQEVNVAGVFYIEITNLCPSNATSNKDRTAIFDVSWSNFNE